MVYILVQPDLQQHALSRLLQTIVSFLDGNNPGNSLDD
jgi:hypothetical protein